MIRMLKISPTLWFDGRAEEAARFYVSVFKNSGISRITYYSDAGFDIHRQPKGRVMTVDFFIEGQNFVALNGGPEFMFSEAVSFIVHCDTQMEVDYFWEKLGEGGDPAAQKCGWLKDKFGLSWQIVPVLLNEMESDEDESRRDRVMQAMLGMKKLDIDKLQQAYNGNQNI